MRITIISQKNSTRGLSCAANTKRYDFVAAPIEAHVCDMATHDWIKLYNQAFLFYKIQELHLTTDVMHESEIWI